MSLYISGEPSPSIYTPFSCCSPFKAWKLPLVVVTNAWRNNPVSSFSTTSTFSWFWCVGPFSYFLYLYNTEAKCRSGGPTWPKRQRLPYGRSWLSIKFTSHRCGTQAFSMHHHLVSLQVFRFLGQLCGLGHLTIWCVWDIKVCQYTPNSMWD